MEKTFQIGSVVSWLFGFLFLAIGFINTFWENDAGYGLFIIILSLVYFPPMTAILQETTGFSVPLAAKIILGLFILWSALGVAELPEKIDLMLKDF
ncbi:MULTISPECIES: hypothetical protein [Pontibacter]|uniref:Uncharacterized protein n=1 Tax=Pontibacter lucknowensis TaxID=1077936 RepID=A0A1N7B444_9BACT|nr:MULTISPECIES: hypothetical protein [Pontibacter]EJF08223.1 hypothetical protein O71_22129 [Pontibacter sp. BAB1700]SIR46084.1 hypothetical protein SAMN05421545_3775 [Pontibacter lucknowensis]